MIGFNRDENGTLFCDDVDLNDIAKEYGTPTYVYSASHIAGQYKKLEGALSKEMGNKALPLLCYACKANSHLAVLKLLKNLGAGLEVVSGGELERGLKAGFTPEKIVMTGVGKQAHEIARAIEVGIGSLNIESIEEIRHVGIISQDLQKPVNILFRVNPDVSGGGHEKISTGRKRDKFGISIDRIREAYKQAQHYNTLNIKGLSMHVGSQIFEVGAFEKAFKKIAELVTELRSEGLPVTTLDIGGGFPIAYEEDDGALDLDSYARWVHEIISPLGVDIVMEPGRFFVGNGGILLTKTIMVKKTPEVDFLVVDAAMNDLIRPTLYEAYHEIAPIQQDKEKQATPHHIVGPVCETGDTFAKDRNIQPCAEGELVAIMSAGAYGFVMASNYNTRGLPAQVMVQGEEHSLIKKRQSFEDLIEGEDIPSWV